MRTGGATVALMFGCSFIVNMAVSIVAPMLPLHLEMRGLLPPGSAGGILKGLLFSVASMATLVVTPLGPTLTAKLGRRKMCTGGIIVFTLGLSTFGCSGVLAAMLNNEPYSDTAPSKAPYTELGLLFLSRVLAASGGTIASLGSMSLALQANPGNSGMIMGSSETALGIGFSVGPSFGAAFFTWGGFVAPFVAVSVIALGMLPLAFLVTRTPVAAVESLEIGEICPQATSRRLSPWRSPSALSVAGIAMTSMLGFGFLDPTLAPFEKRLLNADTAGAGVLFSCAAFPYAVLGIVIGAFLDANPRLGAPMVCCGGVAMGVLLFLLAPIDLFMATWSWQILVLVLVGFATAAGMVPAVPQILSIMAHEAAASGCAAATEDEVLSFAFSSFTIGEMLGPIIGSYAVDALGFETSVHILGVVVCGASVLAFMILGAHGHLGEGLEEDTQVALLGETHVNAHGMDMPRAVGLARAMSGQH
ncbi:unnamed protein product [Polarella glacialis]|uniref:Major facilitator superfamily (MFS) profile domain-containing protein n=1 Tax=Polarella glacialis TaxID=89957 RepID=A0A813FSX0_POLGL|nr:unnamed protein product [Polarella glacialis]CAE8692611.1 unnamed protein product [Polarella glacialis]